MKYLITESQFKMLIERGPNGPAYRGPEGYDDSCDCYVDFQKKFETIAKAIDIESIRPVETPNVQDVRIRFNFMNIKVPKHSSEIKEEELTEKCWPGYTQKGMKTMFGKRYPNCVKKTKK